MKILYFTLGGRGGSDKALTDLLSVLCRDYDVEPLVVCSMSGIIPDLKRLNIPYIQYSFEWALCPLTNTLKDRVLYFPRRLKAMLKRKFDQHRLQKLIEEFHPDIIHSNVGVINIGYYLGIETGIPHIWHLREYQTLDHGMHYIWGIGNLKNYLRKNKYNIGITKGIYDFFELRKPGIQIYDGVRPKRESLTIKNPKGYFIFAGFLFAGKGIDDLLHAYKKYIDMGGNSGLYILGKFDETNRFHQSLKRFVDEKELDGVKFLGFREDVDALMSESTAVIVSSQFEAFGRVACEAMFNGTLVIGRDTAGTKEQMDNLDSFAGKEISLRYQSQEQLVDRMFEADRINQDERQKILEVQFDTVNKLYTDEKSATQIYNYYTDIINRKL